MSRDICASRLGSSPPLSDHSLAGRGGGQRKGRRTLPLRQLRASGAPAFSSLRTLLAGLSAIPAPGSPDSLTPPSSGPARVPALNTPLRGVTAAATAAGNRGCPLFLRGPRRVALKPLGRKAAPSLPGTPSPGVPAPQRHRVRGSDSTRTSPGCG